MSIDLSQFHAAFFDEAAEHLETIERLLLESQPGQTTNGEALNAIFRAAHSIKGSAGTFGFADIAGFTHGLENLLDRIRRGELPLTAGRISVCLKSRDVIADQLVAHRDGASAVDPGRLAEVEAALLAAHGEGADMPVPVAASRPDGGHYLLCWDRQLGHPEGLQDRLAALGIVQPCGEQGEELVFQLQSGLSATDIAESLAFWLPPGQFRLEHLESQGDEAFGVFVDTQPVMATSATEPAAPVDEGWGLFAPPAAATADVSPPVAEPAATGSTPALRQATPQPETSIRVNVEKVDQLLNRIGELVITQSMLAQQVERLGTLASEELQRGMAQLERTTRELQEAVMSVRMLPVASVFGRFPRLVRELGQKLGKAVELQVIGEQTEIDKSFVEKLTDPLTHLVRNSLDHGLESAEGRAGAGKPPVGRLTLRAFHQGGHIVIEVSDDGAGLQRDRILAKAREQGLNVSDTMNDAEVWQLIFEPGFSTAQAVTDVSGRGVGMDVVRRNIEAMGGSIRIESLAGVGTTISLHLPLTLAILDGMSIAIGNEIYILPLSQVVESLQPRAEDVFTLAGQHRLLRVRGECLPLLALWEIFDIQPRVREAHEGLVIIITVASQRVALLVDDLVSQQQFVVKNLETNYRRVRGLAAATILGDGQVAFILDGAEVVRMGQGG
ncbi:chemotaxis protein CheW [Laribacter hongkongensis]|uniref:chemotaxis protein CheW n=1 Tax=Laribacter hongkongensis TaxID=168471 RepID=UPI001EFD76C9|nr:chemotaxis protein CheW [Laribacter hongkongensis]MCG9095973.1 chemotaxis protein CheW [Laribacter hongkongensis]